MKRKSLDTYVSHIGITRVYLSGERLDDFAQMSNAELLTTNLSIGDSTKSVNTLILDFDSIEETIGFLKEIIDLEIPFADNHKFNAFMDASKLQKEGKLKGKIIGC